MASFALPHPFLIYCRVLPPRVCGSPVQLLKGFLRLVRNPFIVFKRFLRLVRNLFRSPEGFLRVVRNAFRSLKGFLRVVRNVFRSLKRFPNVLENAFRRLKRFPNVLGNAFRRLKGFPNILGNAFPLVGTPVRKKQTLFLSRSFLSPLQIPLFLPSKHFRILLRPPRKTSRQRTQTRLERR